MSAFLFRPQYVTIPCCFEICNRLWHTYTWQQSGDKCRYWPVDRAMTYCKTAVSPLRWQWRYCKPALSHRDVLWHDIWCSYKFKFARYDVLDWLHVLYGSFQNSMATLLDCQSTYLKYNPRKLFFTKTTPWMGNFRTPPTFSIQGISLP